MSKRSPAQHSPQPQIIADEHPFAILNTLHTSLSGIYRPIFILHALLAEDAIPPSQVFAAHAELARIQTLYRAVSGRMSREFGPETAQAAEEGIHEQTPLDLEQIDHSSLVRPYPILTALLRLPPLPKSKFAL